MTPEEITAFVRKLRDATSMLAHTERTLRELAESFEARGGQPVFGDDALFIVFLSNDLQTWLTPERKATIARLRTDI